MVNRVACGLSQATNSTPLSTTELTKATLRASRSSLAMIRVACRAPAHRQCGGDLRPIVLLAALDLLERGDDVAAAGGDVPGDRLALRFEAEAGNALCICRNPKVRDVGDRHPASCPTHIFTK